MSHEIRTAAGNRLWNYILSDQEDEIKEADILAIEAEARQPDSEALRRFAQSVVNTCNDPHLVREAESTLAALPPSAPPALDVERLAEAERLADPYGDNNSPADKHRRRTHAEKVAAEYARLASQPDYWTTEEPGT